MALVPGTRLGPYEISAEIGVGGMGEVYRATDTNLKRAVAIKVLPDAVASDGERLARFQREAEVLAALNHPNIAAIYGLERVGSTTALVMEFVDGRTLSDQIAEGPIPFDEALPIARQIAEALEAAHVQGIVHRDLKPANVKVRLDGAVKVLDFGLAKALDVGGRASSVGPAGVAGSKEQDPAHAFSLSPTVTSPAMTRMGVIMGTVAYMSPEQARGSAVDSRTDVWSFGVVLYEMLAGASLFEGHTVSDTLAAVLRADPDWNRLPATLPPAFRQLVRRCLQRDPKRRLQHIGDARLEIDDLQTNRVVTVAEPKAPNRWGLVTSAALLAAAVVGPVAWTLKPSSLAGPATSFLIRTPSDAPVSRTAPLALSFDGRQLVYAVGLGVKRRLVYQSLDAFDPRSLEGTDDARLPFFSPRGDAIAFHNLSVGQIRQLPLAGGAATRLFDSSEMWGASWGDNGSILFVPQFGRPLKIGRLATSASTDLTNVDRAVGEGAHLWPQVLPGSRAVLFTIWSAAPTWDEAQLAVVDVATGRHHVVLRGGTFGRYAASGHLVFWRGSALWAAPFDLEALKVTGEAVRVVPDVRLDLTSGDAHFTLSQTGTLAYVKGRAETFAETFLVDRSGKRLLPLDETESVGEPAFSRDGKQVALTLYRRGTLGVGVFDLGRRQLEHIALTGDSLAPTWRSNDLIAFQCSEGEGEGEGGYAICSSPVGGGGKPERFFRRMQGVVPGLTSSPDGRHLVGTRYDEKKGFDLWQYQFLPQPDAKPLIETMANESQPALSAKGNFIAYVSDESGSLEVYVSPYPKVDAWRRPVSRAGGSRPRWSRDGRAILYISDKGIMTVPVSPGRGEADVLTLGQPSLALSMTGLTAFDVTAEGTFAIERVPIDKAAKEINVVLNWFEELKRLVPTN